MIPFNYTSYLSPINSSKLWNEVKKINKLESFETAYVVKLHNHCRLDEPIDLFYFEHPNLNTIIDNSFLFFIFFCNL